MSKSNFSLLDTIYGPGTFETVPNGSSVTVNRTSQIPIQNEIINNASAAGYSVDGNGSLPYANVYGKGNFEVLGAPNSFVKSLATDPTYFNTINQASGGQFTNATFGSDPNVSLSSSFNPLNESANESSTISNPTFLKYPIRNEGNFDFLKITCLEYVPTGFANENTNVSLQEANKRITKSLGTVALPMQPGLSESNSVGWGEDRLNAIQIVGARLAGNAIENLSNLDPTTAATKFIEGLGAAGDQLLRDSGVTKAAIISYFAGQAVGANIFTRGTGQVINPNLELLFTGPNLRTFNYSYRLTPRDAAEANTIKSIIKFFKKNMAPKKTTTGIFLKTPNVFKLKYIFANGDQHPFLNNIKVCALTSFTVDYTPDGSYMTYGDGSMTSYQIGMQFNELDPIYHNDYDEGEGTQGMGY